MGLTASRHLKQIEADRIADKRKQRDNDHQMKIRCLFMDYKAPDNLGESNDGERHLETTRCSGNLLLSRDCSPDGKERKRVDNAVGKHIEAVGNEAHGSRNKSGKHLESKEKEIDEEHLP